VAGFRTIVINKRCKLESRLGTLIIRSEIEEKVHIAEIETLIVESTAVALSAALIADLTQEGANIIFCDSKHLPCAVFLPLHAHYSTSKNIKEQIAWEERRKAEIWQQIIKEKIRQQALHLLKLGKTDEYCALAVLVDTVRCGDQENAEGRSASLYFRTVFGKGFTRNNSCVENSALNYGYTLVMSMFAREIAAMGYLTELGVWHKGVENAFNLASDLMEPFRVVVDRVLVSIPIDQKQDYKRHMLKVLNYNIRINGESQSFVNAVRIYLHRVFRFMRNEVDCIYNFEVLGEKV